MVYAYEQEDTAELLPQEVLEFRRTAAAWEFFQAAPPGYKKVVLHWVTSAKKVETRAAGLASLLRAGAADHQEIAGVQGETQDAAAVQPRRVLKSQPLTTVWTQEIAHANTISSPAPTLARTSTRRTQ